MDQQNLEYIKALLKWQADVAAWVAKEVAATLAGGGGGVTTQDSGNNGPPPPPPQK